MYSENNKNIKNKLKKIFVVFITLSRHLWALIYFTPSWFFQQKIIFLKFPAKATIMPFKRAAIQVPNNGFSMAKNLYNIGSLPPLWRLIGSTMLLYPHLSQQHGGLHWIWSHLDAEHSSRVTILIRKRKYHDMNDLVFYWCGFDQASQTKIINTKVE